MTNSDTGSRRYLYEPRAYQGQHRNNFVAQCERGSHHRRINSCKCSATAPNAVFSIETRKRAMCMSSRPEPPALTYQRASESFPADTRQSCTLINEWSRLFCPPCPLMPHATSVHANRTLNGTSENPLQSSSCCQLPTFQ